jgi:hypothetical protein
MNTLDDVSTAMDNFFSFAHGAHRVFKIAVFHQCTVGFNQMLKRSQSWVYMSKACKYAIIICWILFFFLLCIYKKLCSSSSRVRCLKWKVIRWWRKVVRNGRLPIKVVDFVDIFTGIPPFLPIFHHFWIS